MFITVCGSVVLNLKYVAVSFVCNFIYLQVAVFLTRWNHGGPKGHPIGCFTLGQNSQEARQMMMVVVVVLTM